MLVSGVECNLQILDARSLLLVITGYGLICELSPHRQLFSLLWSEATTLS